MSRIMLEVFFENINPGQLSVNSLLWIKWRLRVLRERAKPTTAFYIIIIIV